MGIYRSISIALASAGLAAGVCAGSACRQIVGVEDREPPRVCAAEGDGSACQDCLSSACCDELEACDGDATCNGSERLTEAGVALRVCAATSCVEPCALECGGAGVPVIGCEPCGRACCEQAEACAQSSACGLLEVCQQACAAGDVGCSEECRNANVDGASLASAIVECVDVSCDLGADWSCLGAVEWKTPEENEYSVTITLLDNATNQPVPDVEVKGCRGNDNLCDEPFEVGLTGPNGFVRFDVPTATPGSFIEYGGGEYYNHRSYFYPPLVADLGVTLTIVRTSDFEAINRDAGWTLDAGRGVLLVNAVDCRGRPAAGVTFSADTADERTIIAPDETGGAIIFNLPAGVTMISATVSSLCQISGSIDLLVKADALGIAQLPPSP